MQFKHRAIGMACILGISIASMACIIPHFNIQDYDSDDASSLKPTHFRTVFKDEKNIVQWALWNNGIRLASLPRDAGWGADIPKSARNIDIRYHDFSAFVKRQCLVAVIDTAFEINHPYLSSIWTNIGEEPDDGVDNDLNGYVDDYQGWDFYSMDNMVQSSNPIENMHGTQIRIMCLRALGGENQTGTIDAVVDAIRYAENNGAKVCCLSLATYNDSSRVAKEIKNSNMIFVVASGNDGIELTIEHRVFPASYQFDNSISVANLRSDGYLSETSNYSGKVIDLAAPGTDIVSLATNGGYAYQSGTSCAVPFVGGLAAMVYSCAKRPLSAHEIKEIICSNVAVLPSLEGKVLTKGIIDYEATITQAISMP